MRRAIAFTALCGFGLIHWMLMLDPPALGRAAGGLLLAVAAGSIRFDSRRVAVATGLAVGVAGWLVGGLAVADLWPTHWGAVAASIGDGTGALAGARIPYAGTDPDVLFAITLGGVLLALVAGVLAAAEQRLLALIALVVLYAVPAVSVDFEGEFLRGGVFAVLLLAYLRLERLPERELAAAGTLAVAGIAAALAAAPALDGDRPWFDYEDFARARASARTTTFSWEHDYARLPWNRDGREMLRVRASRRSYWKADTLDAFDGLRWTEDPTPGGQGPAGDQNVGVDAANLRRWTFPIAVSVRDLRSDTLVLAGVTEDVSMPGRFPAQTGNDVWSAGRPIRRADAYSADVYVPQPSRAQLEAARGDLYPDRIVEDLTYQASGRDGLSALTRSFRAPPERIGYGPNRAGAELRRTNLGRIFALSRRLLRGASSPYDYVRAVRDHLARGFTYDETPPPAARTLDGFLFDAHAGFCQHYSGAMALLLRMGGVPARVATGFAPGSFVAKAKRYVVRDVDAHSWVEAWFAGIGWVVFDPTPAAAPPRSQAFGADVTAGTGDVRDRGTEVGAAPTAAPDDGVRWNAVALAAALAALAGLAWLLIARRPARATESELERALRGAGEVCAPGTTLTALEARLPGAASYLGELRASRYGRGDPPTSSARRSLRRALSAGRGPVARSRVWLALRPRKPRH